MKILPYFLCLFLFSNCLCDLTDQQKTEAYEALKTFVLVYGHRYTGPNSHVYNFDICDSFQELIGSSISDSTRQNREELLTFAEILDDLLISYQRDESHVTNESEKFRLEVFNSLVRETTSLLQDPRSNIISYWPGYYFDHNDQNFHFVHNRFINFMMNDDCESSSSCLVNTRALIPTKGQNEYKNMFDINKGNKKDKRMKPYKSNENKAVNSNILEEMKNHKEFKMSLHHVIPFSVIETFINTLNQVEVEIRTRDDNTKKFMNNRFNMAVRKRYIGGILYNHGLDTQIPGYVFNIVCQVRSLVFWMYSNTFFGPEGSLRSDDPHNGFEVNSMNVIGQPLYIHLSSIYDRMINFNSEIARLRSSSNQRLPELIICDRQLSERMFAIFEDFLRSNTIHDTRSHTLFDPNHWVVDKEKSSNKNIKYRLAKQDEWEENKEFSLHDPDHIPLWLRRLKDNNFNFKKDDDDKGPGPGIGGFNIQVNLATCLFDLAISKKLVKRQINTNLEIRNQRITENTLDTAIKDIFNPKSSQEHRNYKNELLNSNQKNNVKLRVYTECGKMITPTDIEILKVIREDYKSYCYNIFEYALKNKDNHDFTHCLEKENEEILYTKFSGSEKCDKYKKCKEIVEKVSDNLWNKVINFKKNYKILNPLDDENFIKNNLFRAYDKTLIKFDDPNEISDKNARKGFEYNSD